MFSRLFCTHTYTHTHTNITHHHSLHIFQSTIPFLAIFFLSFTLIFPLYHYTPNNIPPLIHPYFSSEPVAHIFYYYRALSVMYSAGIIVQRSRRVLTSILTLYIHNEKFSADISLNDIRPLTVEVLVRLSHHSSNKVPIHFGFCSFEYFCFYSIALNCTGWNWLFQTRVLV